MNKMDEGSEAQHCFLKPIAGLPDEKQEHRYQGDYDEHPVLHFKTKKIKMLDEKMHSAAPDFEQDRRFNGKNILFSYFERAGSSRALTRRAEFSREISQRPRSPIR
jgi:hypothetical protein